MTRAEVLDQARQIVLGDREETYGGPEESFGIIAAYWSTHLGTRITPADVAVMMGLMKMARLKASNFTSLDSWVDLAGYAACGAEAAGREAHERMH